MDNSSTDGGSKKLPSHNPHVGTLHHGPGFLYSPLIGLPIAFRNNNTSPHIPYIIHAPPQNPMLFSEMLRHCMYIPQPNQMRPDEEEEWVVVDEEESSSCVE